MKPTPPPSQPSSPSNAALSRCSTINSSVITVTQQGTQAAFALSLHPSASATVIGSSASSSASASPRSAGLDTPPTELETKLKAEIHALKKTLREKEKEVAKLTRVADKWEEENRRLLVTSAQRSVEIQELRVEMDRLRTENKHWKEEAHTKRRASH